MHSSVDTLESSASSSCQFYPPSQCHGRTRLSNGCQNWSKSIHVAPVTMSTSRTAFRVFVPLFKVSSVASFILQCDCSPWTYSRFRVVAPSSTTPVKSPGPFEHHKGCLEDFDIYNNWLHRFFCPTVPPNLQRPRTLLVKRHWKFINRVNSGYYITLKQLLSYTHSSTSVINEHVFARSSSQHVSVPSVFVTQQSVRNNAFIFATLVISQCNLLRSMDVDCPACWKSRQVQLRTVPEREQPLQVGP